MPYFPFSPDPLPKKHNAHTSHITHVHDKQTEREHPKEKKTVSVACEIVYAPSIPSHPLLPLHSAGRGTGGRMHGARLVGSNDDDDDDDDDDVSWPLAAAAAACTCALLRALVELLDC